MNKPSATAAHWSIKPMPPENVTLALDGVISAEHFALIQKGYIPSQPTEKWFIYFADGWLHFHRAHSGTCIYSLEINAHEDHYLAPTLIVNQHPKQNRTISATYDLQLLSYLMDRYLFGRNVSFPIPPNMSDENARKHQQHVIGETTKRGGVHVDLNSLLDGLN